MALKPLRTEGDVRVDAFLNEVAERGRMLVWDTTTSGLGDMDDAGNLLKVPTISSGNQTPAGVLLCDMVDIDLSRYRLNEHQNEMQKNSKVARLLKGFVKTNCIVAGVNPVPGSGAYFTTSGEFTMTQPSNSAHSLCGRFGSAKDEDGYAIVEINLP